MKLTIKKTTEETIEINDLPKYFNDYHKKIKITEENIIGVSETMIYVISKDSTFFSKDVADALKLNECSEEEFNNLFFTTINKIKSL